MKSIKVVLTTVLFIAAAGILSWAFAGGGMMGGSGSMGGGMMGQGYGYGMGGGSMGGGSMGQGYGQGSGWMGNGSGNGYYGQQEGNGPPANRDSARLQQAQEQFYKETSQLRNAIRDKQSALNRELNSASPDKDKAIKLQNELSRLQSEYAQKELAFRLKLRNGDQN